MWSFAAPLAFVLLPLPLLAARLLPPAPDHGGALVVPARIAALLDRDGRGGLAAAAGWLLPLLLWTALVTALAGPRVLAPHPALPASGRDIVLAIDLSGSMEQSDFELDGAPAQRLAVVKRMAADFLRRRHGDRIGLVVFGTSAYFAAPPSHDLDAVAQAMEEATIGISGRSTAISEGLGLALKRLEQSSAASRVVILLSDGVNNGGVVQPIDAAELAGRLGIRIHTIALGVRDTTEADSSQDVVDAQTLRAIAEASGGAAFRARSTADLDAVSRALDAMEPTELAERSAEVYREFWIYPAGLAFLLAMILPLVARRVA